MTHILVSLLGARLSEADYVFQDEAGDPVKTRYCALALFDHFKKLAAQPDRLVVLGTPGSCWDVLVEVLHERFGEPGGEKPQTTELEKSIETRDNKPEHPLTQEALDHWEDWVNENAAPPGTRIEFKLVGYASTPQDQRTFIQTIREFVVGADRLTFDLTHSLRHLATLALLAAMIIRKRDEIATSIHYGAFEISEQNNGLSPVIRLDGLLDMLDFLAALSAYDKDGDYAVFAPLFEAQGETDYAARLREASFREYAGNFEKAVKILRELRAPSAMLGGEWQLIGDELDERFSWVENPDLYTRQRSRALKALEQGDLLRATVWGTEAVITRVMVKLGKDPTDRKKRGQLGGGGCTWDNLFRAAHFSDDEYKTFERLNRMRHQFAHAALARPDEGAEKAMATRQDCVDALKTAFDTLLPEPPPS